MLNDPVILRQTMEFARNPGMMQEMMRRTDRAVSNLESLPGGFNHLQRIYRDVQEPMMNAATGLGGNRNPFAELAGGQTGTTQQGRENSEPLPNPWSRAPGTTTTTGSSTASTTGTTGGSAPADQRPSQPGIQNLMSQLTSNPELLQNSMQAPYMQVCAPSLPPSPSLPSFTADVPALPGDDASDVLESATGRIADDEQSLGGRQSADAGADAFADARNA